MTNLSIAEKLSHYFSESFPEEVAIHLEARPVREVLKFLETQDEPNAVLLLNGLSPSLASQILEQLPESQRSDLMKKMDLISLSQVFLQWEPEERSTQGNLLPVSLFKEIKDLISYHPDQAGFLMDPKALTFHPEVAVEEALKRIRKVKNRRILDIFVVDDGRRLTGMASLEDIVQAEEGTMLQQIAKPPKLQVSHLAPREEVIEIFEKSKALNLPVVDIEGRFLGVIRYSAMVSAVEQEALSDLQTMVGAGSEERALSKVGFAFRKRLPWLQINLGTAFLAASVVGIFENTIAKFTALAVLLPVVAGQSGNSGAQALAVTMRGLALREVRLRDAAKIAFKEAGVGLLNGVAVALTTALGVWVWSRNLGLAMVISVALVIAMVIAGLSGAMIPMILTALRQDPAQSSSIVLTTVTDVVGFFAFLGLATLFSSLL